MIFKRSIITRYCIVAILGSAAALSAWPAAPILLAMVSANAPRSAFASSNVSSWTRTMYFGWLIRFCVFFLYAMTATAIWKWKDETCYSRYMNCDLKNDFSACNGYTQCLPVHCFCGHSMDDVVNHFNEKIDPINSDMTGAKIFEDIVPMGCVLNQFVLSD